MANAWDDLPNAKHIDRILELFTRDAARDAVRDAAWDVARDAAWGAARYAARYAAWDVARDAAWGAARGALLALIAWDDCAYLLDLPPDAVRLIAVSGNHAAVLMLPTIVALNKEPA
jgi:hypothetical protein